MSLKDKYKNKPNDEAMIESQEDIEKLLTEIRDLLKAIEAKP